MKRRREEERQGGGHKEGKEPGSEAEKMKEERKEGGSEAGRRKKARVGPWTVVTSTGCISSDLKPTPYYRRSSVRPWLTRKAGNSTTLPRRWQTTLNLAGVAKVMMASGDVRQASSEEQHVVRA